MRSVIGDRTKVVGLIEINTTIATTLCDQSTFGAAWKRNPRPDCGLPYGWWY